MVNIHFIRYLDPVILTKYFAQYTPIPTVITWDVTCIFFARMRQFLFTLDTIYIFCQVDLSFCPQNNI